MKCVLCSSKEELLNNGVGAIIEKQKELCLLKAYDTPNDVEDKIGVIGAVCFNKKVLLLMVQSFLNDKEEKAANNGMVSDLQTYRGYKEMIDFLGDYSNLELEANTHMTMYLLNNFKRILVLTFDEYYKRNFEKYENIEIQDVIDITDEIEKFTYFIGELIDLKTPLIMEVIKTEKDNDEFLAIYLNNALVNNGKYTLDEIDVSPEEGKIQLIDTTI